MKDDSTHFGDNAARNGSLHFERIREILWRDNWNRRDGQHAWQEATVDNLVPPVYVWHVREGHGGEPLVHGLKSYYGKLPAVVELFAQAGADVGDHYAGVMREDVAVPDLDDEKLAV
ncbi:APO protein 3, mitochondrial [Morella rubra]|uniref:APO protein 3, mitochondrial n=1 Tax=Morella rubra TaxID=262757 RepID=A0A6A1WM21_9ROSI|nr:APO protein 3, mitochondrial [Morella rubra]